TMIALLGQHHEAFDAHANPPLCVETVGISIDDVFPKSGVQTVEEAAQGAIVQAYQQVGAVPTGVLEIGFTIWGDGPFQSEGWARFATPNGERLIPFALIDTSTGLPLELTCDDQLAA